MPCPRWSREIGLETVDFELLFLFLFFLFLYSKSCLHGLDLTTKYRVNRSWQRTEEMNQTQIGERKYEWAERNSLARHERTLG